MSEAVFRCEGWTSNAAGPAARTTLPLFGQTDIDARLLRQLLEAALFEGLLDYVHAPARSRGWGTVYFTLAKVAYRCAAKLGGFGRLRLKVENLSQVQSIATPVSFTLVFQQLLDSLPATPDVRLRFERELLQTRHWCRWNEQHLEPQPDRRALPLPALETALHEGHPYHPCFKARIGFNEQDHRRYSPEADALVRPHWIAVPRHRVCASGAAQKPDFWRWELGEAGYRTLCDRARVRGLEPDDVTFVPVHPWQWQHVQALCPDSALVDLGQPGDDYRATLSVRTLMNRSRPAMADLKLPLNIVNTSSPRLLLQHGIESAPILSDWLSATVEGDAFFQRYPLIILREYAGLRVASGDQSDYCSLGAIWRESVLSTLGPNEQALPMLALHAVEADGRPFIDPWVSRYGLVPWLQQLLPSVVLPIWHLLARHGIALEAHAQNTVLVHEQGWPVRLAARDFHESLEYVEDFLADPVAAPDFPRQPRYAQARPNQYYWMESVEALRELVMDTLFVFHLSELADVCERFYDFSDSDFWRLVSRLLHDYEVAGHCPPERLAALNYRAPMIQAESLLRKKLCVRGDEYHHRVFNPLATVSLQEA